MGFFSGNSVAILFTVSIGICSKNVFDGAIEVPPLDYSQKVAFQKLYGLYLLSNLPTVISTASLSFSETCISAIGSIGYHRHTGTLTVESSYLHDSVVLYYDYVTLI